MIFLQEINDKNFSVDPSTMCVLVRLLAVEGEDGELFRMIKKLVPRDKKAVS